MRIILSMFFLVLRTLAQVNVTWASSPCMETNTLTVITNSIVVVGSSNSSARITPAYSYNVTLNKTYSSAVQICMGIIGFEIQPSTGKVYFSSNSSKHTTNGFVYTVSMNSSTTIMQVRVNYIVCDSLQASYLTLDYLVSDPISDLSDYNTTSSGSGYRPGGFEVLYDFRIDSSHDFIDLTFILAFSIASGSDNIFTVGISQTITSDTTGNLLFWTSGKCKVYFVTYYSLMIDKTQVEQNQNLFMDVGTFNGVSNVQTSNAVIQQMSQNGYLFGINFFKFDFSLGNSGFNLSLSDQTISPLGSYSQVNISYFNFRVRVCPVDYPYYFLSTQKCYTQCPGMSFLITQYTYCQACYYTCATCPDAVICNTCNASDYRVINGTECDCMPGFYDINDTTCSSCSDGCSSCNNGSTCQTCNTAGGYSKSGNFCKCNSTSYSNTTVCLLCVSSLMGCTSCTSAMACTSCLPTNYTLNASTNSCSCSTGYGVVGGSCQLCSSFVNYCLACSDQNTCTQCVNTFSVANGQCVCQLGTYQNTANSVCMSCDSTCLTCSSGQANGCTSCAAFMVSDSGSGTCVCPKPGYVTNGTDCVMCSDLCSSLVCTGSSTSVCMGCGCPCLNGFFLPAGSSTCQACNITDLQVPTTNCTCPLGMYIDQLNPNSCSSCDYSCLQCTGPSNTTCTKCNFTLHRSLSNGICQCDPFFMDTGVGNCAQLVCTPGYSITSLGVCSPVCGDGLVAPEQGCDDNNTISRDGCSSSCTVETNYTCSGNLTTASVCSYAQPISISIVSIVKDPLSNNLTYQIQISPNISGLSGLNFSQVLDLGLPSSSQITYSLGADGILTALVHYDQGIQNIPTNIKFDPSNSSSPVFNNTPSSALNYTVTPTNYLSADVYPDSVYQSMGITNYLCLALVGLSFAAFSVGMYSGKLIGTEMMWVVQLGFMGLLVLDFNDPLYQPLRNLKYVNGFSIKFTDVNQNMPLKLSSLGFMNSVVNNYNIMLGLSVIVGLIGAGIYIASKVVKQDALKTKLLIYSKLVFGEYMMAVVLLTLYQLVASLCVQILYPYESGVILYASYADACLYVCILVLLLSWFGFNSNKYFGEYKDFFKQTVFLQRYYYIPVVLRMCIATILVVVEGAFYSGVGTVVLLAIELVLLGVFRPFKDKKHNVRGIVNSVISILVMGVYTFFAKYKRPAMPSILYYAPFLVLALLFASVGMNLGFMIENIVSFLRNKKALEQEEAAAKVQKQAADELEDLALQAKKKAQERKQSLLRKRSLRSSPKKSIDNMERMMEIAAGVSLLNKNEAEITPRQMMEMSIFPMLDNDELDLNKFQLHAVKEENQQEEGAKNKEQSQHYSSRSSNVIAQQKKERALSEESEESEKDEGIRLMSKLNPQEADSQVESP